MMIPYDDSKRTQTSLGLNIFERGLTLLSEKRIKGLAMMSNYEHHFYNYTKEDGQTHQFDMPEDEEVKLLEFASSVFRRCGKVISQKKGVYCDELWDNDDHLEIIENNLMNVIFAYDLSLNSYSFFLDLKSGEILKRKDAYERCNKEWEKEVEAGRVRWMPYGGTYLIPKNYLLLKPYKEVVEALLS